MIVPCAAPARLSPDVGMQVAAVATGMVMIAGVVPAGAVADVGRQTVGTSTSAIQPTAAVAPGWRKVMLARMNAVRAAAGVAPLQPCPALRRSAQEYAMLMSSRDHFGHVGPGRQPAAGADAAPGVYLERRRGEPRRGPAECARGDGGMGRVARATTPTSSTPPTATSDSATGHRTAVATATTGSRTSAGAAAADRRELAAPSAPVGRGCRRSELCSPQDCQDGGVSLRRCSLRRAGAVVAACGSGAGRVLVRGPSARPRGCARRPAEPRRPTCRRDSTCARHHRTS